MKKIKILVGKYYFFGLVFLLIFYYIINEISYWYTIERDWKEWIITIVSIPIIGNFAQKFLLRSLKKEKPKYFGLSFFTLFASWISLLYSKTLIIGIIDSFKSEKMEVIESLTSYTIYQLWIYSIFGIIHGIIGGYFLSRELKALKLKAW